MNYDKAICALYKAGFCIDEIADLLNISIKEVDTAVFYYFFKAN